MGREISPQPRDSQYPPFAEIHRQVVGVARYLQLDHAESETLTAYLATSRRELDEGKEEIDPWKPHNYVLSLETKRITNAPLIGPYHLFQQRLMRQYTAARALVRSEQDPRWRLVVRYFGACQRVNQTLNYVETKLTDVSIPAEKRAAHALHFFFTALEEIKMVDDSLSHCIQAGAIDSIIQPLEDGSSDGPKYPHVGLKGRSYDLKRRIEDKLYA
jgi:hypothetical protein